MKFLRIILFPFIPLYALGVKLRNWLFDINYFKSANVDAKVISVGNLTVGGSGKTPLAIYLLKLIKNEGITPGVLSRGYGRQSKGYVLVADKEKILVDVETAGDEIYHTVEDCNVPAAVAENRVDGARQFISDTGINTLILDDAFQHRWLNRNVNLLIIEQRFLCSPDFLEQNLLPTGNLREPFSSIKRADAVIINRKFSEPKEIPVILQKYFEGKKVFKSYYKSTGFIDVTKHTEYPIEDFQGQKSLIVSGIANPYSFVNALKQIKVGTQNKLIFRDHKNYRLKEVQKIRKEFYATNSYSVITTQKDAVKLSKFSKELDDIDIFYLKIDLLIDEEDQFKNYLLNQIN